MPADLCGSCEKISPKPKQIKSHNFYQLYRGSLYGFNWRCLVARAALCLTRIPGAAGKGLWKPILESRAVRRGPRLIPGPLVALGGMLLAGREEYQMQAVPMTQYDF